MQNDIYFLKEALKLAKKGLGWASPNPMVGAIIVKNGHIIGKGFHQKAGLPHAEIEALNSLTEDPKGSTLYVNLEPCSCFGKTPPCINKIIESGIKQVVCCTLDPNPKVNGKGKALLEKAGVEVFAGVLEIEAKLLNEAFFTFHQKKRPFVAIKFATSLDGKMATQSGDSKWITNKKARIYARNLRGAYQAILVGIKTILADNPSLDTRIKGRKNPLRIILDPTLQIPLDAKVLRDENVLIVASSKTAMSKRKKLEEKGFTVLVISSNNFPVQELLSALKEREIISILVEGGGKTLGSFVDSKIVDKVYAFHAPLIIGGEKSVIIGGKGVQNIEESIRLTKLSFKRFDDNFLISGYTR